MKNDKPLISKLIIHQFVMEPPHHESIQQEFGPIVITALPKESI